MEFDIDSLIAELGVVPPPNTISDVSLINQHPEPLLIPSGPGNNPLLQLPPRQISHCSSIFIEAVVPPVPPKLVDRIKGGEFVDMAELLPDRIGSINPSSTDESAKQKVRWRPVTSIIEWVQCFNVYLSMICRTYPERIPDLLTYQMLIIEASMVYEGNAWLGYDRRFRQAAAANPGTQWSKTDIDLWHLAFTGAVKRSRCMHCLSLSHKFYQCNWASESTDILWSPTPSNWSSFQGDPNPQSTVVCRSWNRDPRPGCSFPNCKYKHICSLCVKNPASGDKSHKAVLCPYRS